MELPDKIHLALTLIVIQILGILMLAFGLAAFLWCKMCATHEGDKWVLFVAIVAAIALPLIYFYDYKIYPLLRARHTDSPNRYTKSNPFGFLMALAWTDLALLLFVVLLTGGLKDSFYASLFPVVPTMTWLVQEKPKRKFTVAVFIASAICIFLSALANWLDIQTWLEANLDINSTIKHYFHSAGIFVVSIFAIGMAFADFYLKSEKETEQEIVPSTEAGPISEESIT